MDPSILNFLMSASLAAQFSKYRLQEESKVPTGIKTMTLTVTTGTSTITLATPWMRFTLNNESSSVGVLYAINDENKLQDAIELNPKQSITIDLGYPIIDTIYLKTNSSKANVELVGVEGVRNA